MDMRSLATLRRVLLVRPVYVTRDATMRALVVGPWLFAVERFAGNLRVHFQGPGFAARIVVLP